MKITKKKKFALTGWDGHGVLVFDASLLIECIMIRRLKSLFSPCPVTVSLGARETT